MGMIIIWVLSIIFYNGLATHENSFRFGTLFGFLASVLIIFFVPIRIQVNVSSKRKTLSHRRRLFNMFLCLSLYGSGLYFGKYIEIINLSDSLVYYLEGFFIALLIVYFTIFSIKALRQRIIVKED